MEQQFIEYVVKQLVDNPDEVKVEVIVDDRGTLLLLSVAPADLGRVIGRHGATAQSLRNLLRALGTKNNSHYNLKIVDTDAPEGERFNDRPRPSRMTDDQEVAETPRSAPEPMETEKASPVKDVDKTESETVENTSDFASGIRKGLADLDDLDI